MVSGERIEAAGVLLVRPSEHGPEVCVVHRPRRSDWSLPKGKLEPGERHDVAAVREALEETGVRCRLGPSLGSRKYEVLGVPKRVRYWRATVVEELPREADDEIDEVRWLGREDARALLTYDDDRALVDSALELPDTMATVVVRHAQAVKRGVWRRSEDPLARVDAERPLTALGTEQAELLVPVLAGYGAELVVSSSSRRCRDTVTPYARSVPGELHLRPELSEEGFEEDPRATEDTVRELMQASRASVWCTHRPVMGTVLGVVADELGLRREDGTLPGRLTPRLRPGAGVVLHRSADGAVVAIDRFET